MDPMRFVLLLALIACAASAQTHKVDGRWAPLGFLIGEWTGEGGGGPGEGTGGFSFLPDQDGKILVRKNRADYPASKDRPAFSHTDLMIVYKEDSKLRAIYFDTEDHVIHYDVTPAADGKSVRFLSGNYRLTYTQTATDRVAIRFEVAAPGKPGAFETYIDASARRVRN
ncbi:MAG TPA: hypothetical protein VKX49_23270 [Bryobacteraceae bacterium]|nr:hypothetical protein [Bryobacteraceae bacterium]